jgi:hypothetical protein
VKELTFTANSLTNTSQTILAGKLSAKRQRR